MELRSSETKIIILSGKARSGKDTSGEIIEKFYESIGLKVIKLAYADYIKTYAKHISNWDGSDETKPRELLQNLGTEVIRERIDKLFFINRMIEDIKVYSYFFDVIIISDARIPDEIDKIKDNFSKVISINIIRPGFVNELSSSEKQHITEIGLDDYKNYDIEIVNDSSIEDLNNKICNVLRSV